MPYPTRFVNLDAARARFGARVDRLAPYFSAMDPLADDVVAEMATLPPGQGFRALDQALSHGLSSATPRAVRALVESLEDVPPWADEQTLDRAGELLMRSGVLGGLVLAAKSIVHGYASPAGNKPLVLSGRLLEQAPRRLNETSRFVQAVCRPGGMRRFGDGFVITVKVRVMHAQVRRMCLASGRWDAAAWGAPVNQHDMAATTLLFSLALLEGLRTFGLAFGDDEAERYMHLFRYVGHVIGVDARLLPTGQLDGMNLAELIYTTQGAPDDDARALVKALMHSGIAQTKDKARDARTTAVGYGICRGLVGDELADQLGVPRDPYRFALPAMRAMTRAAEAVRLRFPAAHRTAVEQGTRYWDRVVTVGLAGATAEFRLPELHAA
ncbi:MAG: DUF2236 domain-containing protein [Myxococcales bacterium]|nr:DUF2236 domain-containing protein [Myxococcales bacterium]